MIQAFVELVCVHPLGLHVNLRNVAQVVERSLWEREVSRVRAPPFRLGEPEESLSAAWAFFHIGVAVSTCGRTGAGDRMSMVSGCGLMAERLEKEDKVRFLEKPAQFLGSVCRAAKAADCKSVTLETPGVRFPPLPLSCKKLVQNWLPAREQ